jgi:hypothetical protein
MKKLVISLLLLVVLGSTSVLFSQAPVLSGRYLPDDRDYVIQSLDFTSPTNVLVSLKSSSLNSTYIGSTMDWGNISLTIIFVQVPGIEQRLEFQYMNPDVLQLMSDRTLFRKVGSSTANNRPESVTQSTSGAIRITIVNSTGFTVTDLYVSPSSNTHWGTNLLNRGTIIRNDQYV